ncbi:MAG: GTP 3',8-cyclase MoaA, partial [Clostridia bacterium]|nr:GTP 3',8-cyclase MoaA [Clostridia bacterium]
RLEEFLRIIKVAAGLGVKKIRLTGGEPLVRKGVVDFISKIKEIPGIEDIALTTNGALLADMAGALKKAGLNRINISLDTLVEEKFTQITRVGSLATVMKGIEKALAVGFEPVKLNVVVIAGFNFDEVLNFVALTKDKPLHVRFIELMPIGETDEWDKKKYISAGEILDIVKQEYQVVNSTGIKGAGPAKYMSIPGHLGSIGFITAMSNHFCNQCNRMRLTSEGKLRPCLHGDQELDLKALLRSNCSDQQLAKVIVKAIKEKPLQHRLKEKELSPREKMMFQIGG